MKALLSLLALAGCDAALAPPKGDAPQDTDDTTEESPTVPGDTDEPTEPTRPPGPDMLDIQTVSGRSDNQGLLLVPVQVDADTTSFMVTGTSTLWVGLERLYDPDGRVVLTWEDWWDSDYSLTSSFFAYDKTTAFNWPVRAEDGPLQQGEWTVELWVSTAQGGYASNVAVDVTVHRKSDPDLTRGVVRADVWYADGVADDISVVTSVERAVDRWREVWSPMGIDLEVTYLQTPLDPRLGFTYSGSDDVEGLASTLPKGQLVLIVGEQIRNEADTYGISAGIPGTLAASPMTFVVVSWLAHAGQDGVFQAGEIALMGETMAHEVGHYMGLFHPVESNYQYWDALDDTPACTSWFPCERDLGDNLMFPYPICDFQGCLSQDQLTPGQQAVSHRYTGTL